MSQVRKKIRKIPVTLREEIIKLAWADTVPFETIHTEYGLTENETKTFMRAHQKPRTYVRWRKRVTNRNQTSSKHRELTSKTSNKIRN